MTRLVTASLLLAALAASLAGCGGASSGPGADNSATRPAVPARGGPSVPTVGGGALGAIDAVRLYQAMGLLADGPPVAFVGSVAYLGSGAADSTLMLVTLSIANRALVFAREGDRFTATYATAIEVRYYLPEHQPDKVAILGEKYRCSCQQLWSEDEAMMRHREAMLQACLLQSHQEPL